MNPYGRTDAYRESAILTASPEQLVVHLYDGALRFLRQGQVLLEQEGATVQAVDRLNRATAIVDELLMTLDKERGGELAERLEGIYVFCKRLLIDARLERDPSKIGTVVTLLAELRESWAQLAKGGAPAPAPATPTAPVPA
ncbi:flagellar export chaperone FliS [Conexibacter sp. SYSU D00693]|uniref:flagellar export chaperone FliS n=1 Tax=Conexibacter sp. SYSU D00693 TaxID=2812560 RepID=UPI00196B23BD|nr:flagellar export chaperone FliS [Conexibacter sp. SYSU D00693]